ncbi:hypothetical protein [Bacillus salipaludis]|uniref:Uncharacterized protein n=1 Tax=Bacillus salipaludis TaxID=2547811 RepID=A0AA90QZ42_9BACI|nr:hypothetical protein [Bacillus salipaludis]MDQ6598914.1 hypothetical protein [Bacillus salipaludis]
MFFLNIMFSLILSVSGGILLQKHGYVWGGSLLTVGILFLIYTIIYYSRKNKRIDLRNKKRIEKKIMIGVFLLIVSIASMET